MKKRIAAILLSFCMFLTLTPTMIHAANELYDLYIYAGKNNTMTRVTSNNADDVLNDGGSVSYDPINCILTLNNAEISGILSYGNESKTLTIDVIGDCKIESQKQNAINLQSMTTSGPIYHQDSLIITGDGTLVINALSSYGVGISTYDDVTIQDANVEINVANSMAIALQNNYNPALDDIDLNIINSTVTATTKGTMTNAFWSAKGGIKITNSVVTVNTESSSYPSLWAATSIEFTDSSNVEVIGGSGNAIYAIESSIINNSTVKASVAGESAGFAVYTGNLIIENKSNVTSESSQDSAFYIDGDMKISDSEVTAVGNNYEGIVVNGSLDLTGSTLTVKRTTNQNQSAITTEKLNIEASELTADGGIHFYNNLTGTDSNIAFTLTPAEGKPIELKTDNEHHDGSSALHFKDDTASPYDAATTFDADIMKTFDSFKYIHIGEHTHAGGTATCTTLAICDDCGKEYGSIDPDNHSFTNYVYNNDATCTSNGTETAKCDRCGMTHTREKIDTMLEHDIAITGAKEPTCTIEGYTGDKICKICGEIMEKGQVIPKLTHRYVNGKCAICGAIDPNYKPSNTSIQTDKDTNDKNDLQTGTSNILTFWIVLLFLSGLTATAVILKQYKE